MDDNVVWLTRLRGSVSVIDNGKLMKGFAGGFGSSPGFYKGDVVADHRDFARRLKQACDGNPLVPEYGKGQQVWFADRMELSQEAVRRWFEGESRPRPMLESAGVL